MVSSSCKKNIKQPRILSARAQNLKGDIENGGERTTCILAGKYYPKSKATTSVYNHDLLYGDGVFEGIRAYNGSVFKLKEHVNRLYASTRAIKLKIALVLVRDSREDVPIR